MSGEGGLCNLLRSWLGAGETLNSTSVANPILGMAVVGSSSTNKYVNNDYNILAITHTDSCNPLIHLLLSVHVITAGQQFFSTSDVLFKFPWNVLQFSFTLTKNK